ncbi:MAG: ABC transporter permease [Rubripirellula sp.]|nr:ABC transporter permease [Rubripirellula sp.]
MRKLLAIARREFTAMVVTKTFVFSLIMMPILMAGGLFLIPALTKLSGTKERRIIVADATDALFDSIQQAAEQRNTALAQSITTDTDNDSVDSMLGAETFRFERSTTTTLSDEQRLELSDQIREGQLYAFVEIPAEFPTLADGSTATFVSQDAALSQTRGWLESFLRQQSRRTKLLELGLDPELVAQANVAVALTPNTPFEKTDDGSVTSKDGMDTLTSMFLPFGIMMLMFMVIFMAAQPMLESAMEEKQHRIAELLLGSVTSTELMAGKLIGNVAGSFVIFTFYACGALIVANKNALELSLDWTQLPWLIVFQILGVLLYSSIFLTIGASVSELKEAQSLLLPVWLLLMSPLMVWFVAVRDPNGIVAVSLSFFPPSTPLMMSLRLSSGQTLPIWHAPMAAILMLTITTLVIMTAGRLYRISLLRTDSAASIKQMFQRLRATAK